MSIHFERPVGAAADVKELEYVSALHQTDPSGVRTDGSIRDEDIQVFLLSRYGIDVTVDHVRETVMKGLGGGSGEDDCIDLMEMVAILMIPTLLKAAQVETTDVPLNPKLIFPRPGLLEFVLGMILSDVTGGQEPKQLDATLMKEILNAYGEEELAEDEKLVTAMIQAAHAPPDPLQDEMETTNDVMFDLQSFARALTHDVQVYDVTNEVRVASNYDDVFPANKELATDAANVITDGELSPKGTESTDEETAAPPHRESSSSQLQQSVERRDTASAIDFVAGTYRSKALTVLLWASFILTYFAYNYNFAKKYTSGVHCKPYDYSYENPWTHNREAIACGVATSSLQWIIMFVVTSLYGMAFVGLGSIGNSVYCIWYGKPMIGAFAVFWATFVPFWTQKYQAARLSEESNRYLRMSSLILGFIVCFLHLTHAYTLYYAQVQKSLRWKQVFDASTVLGEVHIKSAAAHKLSEMVQNAFDILRLREHEGVVDTNFGHGMFAFAKHGRRYREEGGYVWAYRRVLNGDLMKKEGIWFSARFLASNIAQYIVSIFVLLAGIGLTVKTGSEYNSGEAKLAITKALNNAINLNVDQTLVTKLMDGVTGSVVVYMQQQIAPGINCSDYFAASGSNTTELSFSCETVNGTLRCNHNATFDYVCALLYPPVTTPEINITANASAEASQALSYLTASGYDVNETRRLIESGIANATNSAVLTLYPAEEFMLTFPLIAGTLVAFLVSIYLAVTYLPSVTSTTLQLRSGVIPTMHDKNFHKYRKTGDRVTIVTGSMFWGALFSSTIVGGIVGIIVFVFVWQVTVFVSQKIVALIAGLLFIILLKQFVLRFCRCAMYRSFYRKRPASANVTALALECANFALSVGFIFIRMVKLIVAAAVFIGRIDTPFLAPGVGRIGGIEFDNYPYIYREDILASEAHRHPYIETLGVMYMMKLRHGENFGKTAGSCWRLLFVYALMPWLHKYRVLARPDLRASMAGSDTRSLRNMRSLRALCSSVDDNDNNVNGDDSEPRNHRTSQKAPALRKLSDSKVPHVNEGSRSWHRFDMNPENDGAGVWRFRGQQVVPKDMESSWDKSVSRIDNFKKVLQEKNDVAAGKNVEYVINDNSAADVDSVVAGLEELQKEMEELMMENDSLRTKLHHSWRAD